MSNELLHAGSHLLVKYLFTLLVHNINKLDYCIASYCNTVISFYSLHSIVLYA